MKAKDIVSGKHYRAKVSGKLVTVRVDEIRRSGRDKKLFLVTNLSTNRRMTFRSAARFRFEVTSILGKTLMEVLNSLD
jgi:hypothetical protein